MNAALDIIGDTPAADVADIEALPDGCVRGLDARISMSSGYSLRPKIPGSLGYQFWIHIVWQIAHALGPATSPEESTVTRVLLSTQVRRDAVVGIGRGETARQRDVVGAHYHAIPFLGGRTISSNIASVVEAKGPRMRLRAKSSRSVSS